MVGSSLFGVSHSFQNILGKQESLGLGTSLFIGAWIAFGICADSLYHNSVKKKIAAAQLSVKDEPKPLELLRHKGGVNTWVIWVFPMLPVIGILAAIAIPAYTDYTASTATPMPKIFERAAAYDDIDRFLDEPAQSTDGKAASAPTLHPWTQAWLDRNAWFNNPDYDQATRRARAIDAQLHDEGYRVENGNYFEELDRRLIKAGVTRPAVVEPNPFDKFDDLDAKIFRP